jgi:hypothetical protein
MMMPLPFRKRSPAPRPRWAPLARWVGALPAVAAALWAPSAYPCAIAFAPGEYAHVASEDAIIRWDETTHVEQFIRSAKFRTDAKSFAFLVPTPTRPTIDEVAGHVFDDLASVMTQETEGVANDRWPSWDDWRHWRGSFEEMIGGAPPIAVFSSGSVGGLDTVVLQASSADAVAAWLGEHGFALRPALRDWLDVYIAKGWSIAAFRYPGPSTAGGTGAVVDSVRSAAIRISFKTEEPVYPYREPDDVAAHPDRLLRLFLVTRQPAAALLGGQEGAPWAAERVFAKAVQEGAFPLGIPSRDANDHLWLTEFLDPTTQRPPIDVTFRTSPSLREVVPMQIRHQASNLYGLFEIALAAAAFGGVTTALVAGVIQGIRRLLGAPRTHRRSAAAEG